MKVLVVNVGSTSFKYKLFEMDDESVLASGGADRVKSERGLFFTKLMAKQRFAWNCHYRITMQQ